MNPNFTLLPGRLPSRFKLLAVALITTAAIVHLLNTGYGDWSAGADTAYVLGLLFLFFSKESIDDERVRALKLQALAVAFVGGWAFVGAVRFWFYLQDRSTPPRPLSAYDGMFVMLLLAHGFFQFWRLQDGWPPRETRKS